MGRWRLVERSVEEWVAERERCFLTLAEREMRYAKTRRLMRQHGIDCLVVCAISGSWFHEGNVRYFVGDRFKNESQDEYVVFPLEADPALVLTYSFRVPWAAKGWIADIRAPEDVRGKDPRFAHVKKRSVSIASIIKEKGYAGGVIGYTPDITPAAVYHDLAENLPGAKLVDCSGLMLEARRVKSAEEITLVRRAAAMADQAHAYCCNTVRAGILEHQLWSGWTGVLTAGGCEKTFDLIVSDPISPACVKWPQEPHILTAGDTVVTEISPCFGGYFTQLVRAYTVGTMHPRLKEVASVCREAFAAGEAELRPGIMAKQVARAIENVLNRNNLVPLARCGHTSTGLDLMEIPLHPDDETMLEPGMVMILHPIAGVPGYKVGDPGFFGPGDTYLITETGAERLTRCSQDIYSA